MEVEVPLAAVGGGSEKKRARGEDGGKQAAGSAKGGKDQNDVKKIVAVLCKLSLADALGVRILKAAVIQTVLIATESVWVVTIRAATKKYVEITKDMEKDEKFNKFGLPHAHAWNAVIKVMTDKAVASGDEDAKKKLDEYVQVAKSQGGFNFFLDSVKVFRLFKAYDKEKIKIEVAIKDSSAEAQLWATAVTLMRGDGGRLLPGTAPPGQLEGLVQTFLDKNQ